MSIHWVGLAVRSTALLSQREDGRSSTPLLSLNLPFSEELANRLASDRHAATHTLQGPPQSQLSEATAATYLGSGR